MVQDKTDDFDWTIHKGATPSHGTGPDTAADGSWYMYLEASNPRQLGDEALWVHKWYENITFSLQQR